MSRTDREADQIFAEAMHLDGAERDRLLAARCGDRPELRAAVEELLDLGDTTDRLPGDDRRRDRSDAGDDHDTVDGRRIGPYRLLREIGRGGMGVVYLAERADGQFEKRVAIKVVQGDRSERQARFSRERQILANLEHPGIARLLDGGFTEEGWPYLAMEYVDGEPIDTYCEHHDLSVRERVVLFLEVCRAVRAAHEVLVIHRDLKPGNIFVTQSASSYGTDTRGGARATGEHSSSHTSHPVKLLDFGIAKLLHSDATDEAGLPAAETARLMTPAYASPEQFRGEPLGMASDIYQLGLLLHLLLVGSLPYHAHRAQPEEAARLICVLPPPSPSRHYLARQRRDGQAGADTRSWYRALRGDLDNIVAMALAKRPVERYRSVDQLISDLESYLQGRPVSARRQTVLYQASRFLGRHRLAAGTASVLLALLISLVVGYTIRLRAERDRAEAALEESETVSALLVDLFEVSDPERAPGEPIDALALLDLGAERLMSGNDQALDEHPLARARFLQTVGEIYAKLAQYDRAAGAIEEALRLRRRILPADDEKIVESMGHLGALYGRLGRFDEAEALLEPVLAARERLGGSGDPRAGEELAVSLNNLANLRWHQGRPEEGEALHRRCLALRERLHGASHVRVADTANNLGSLLLIEGREVEAAELLRRAIDIFSRVYGRDHPQRAVALHNLALVETRLALWPEAEQDLQEVLEVWTEAYGAGHPRTLTARLNLGDLQRRRGRLAEAVTTLREALRLQRQSDAPEPLELARTESILGVTLGDLGAHDEAEATLRSALGVRRQALGDDHPSTISVRGYLARLEFLRGRWRQAETEQRAVLADKLRVRGSDHRSTQQTRVELAETLLELGEREEARSLLETALAARRTELAAGHPELAKIEELLARAR